MTSWLMQYVGISLIWISNISNPIGTYWTTGLNSSFTRLVEVYPDKISCIIFPYIVDAYSHWVKNGFCCLLKKVEFSVIPTSKTILITVLLFALEKIVSVKFCVSFLEPIFPPRFSLAGSLLFMAQLVCAVGDWLSLVFVTYNWIWEQFMDVLKSVCIVFSQFYKFRSLFVFTLLHCIVLTILQWCQVVICFQNKIENNADFG